MGASSRLRMAWTDDELTVIVEMYFQGNKRDGHGHDRIAAHMGRYNPNTRSHRDGAINQKLGEIMGYVNHGRVPRHAGERLMRLVDKYRDSPDELRKEAVAAWHRLAPGCFGPEPAYVSRLLQ
jgi:hypothetical protein